MYVAADTCITKVGTEIIRVHIVQMEGEAVVQAVEEAGLASPRQEVAAAREATTVTGLVPYAQARDVRRGNCPYRAVNVTGWRENLARVAFPLQTVEEAGRGSSRPHAGTPTTRTATTTPRSCCNSRTTKGGPPLGPALRFLGGLGAPQKGCFRCGGSLVFGLVGTDPTILSTDA
ncbi:hypothetical protein GWK47_035551 [Chionoecetes opilio]|uniref:Uncharacterized protein n=1 Tax=Chionoecetes opilio TaxID=41210 RepID=A0A8J4YN73_CHIOP|nr:hypothetical protein GWK47_035551 [Chionoecetes opilio]